MSLNENIKYCKKPVEKLFDNKLDREEKRFMSCISQIAKDCVKSFKTTKERRICWICTDLVNVRNRGALK